MKRSFFEVLSGSPEIKWLALARMSGVSDFLHSSDPFQSIINRAVANQVQSLVHEQHQDLANRIANAVGKMLKGDG